MYIYFRFMFALYHFAKVTFFLTIQAHKYYNVLFSILLQKFFITLPIESITDIFSCKSVLYKKFLYICELKLILFCNYDDFK